MNELRILAVRSSSSDQAIICGSCNTPIADSENGVLKFVLDSDPEWKGWVRGAGWSRDSPGGLWEVAAASDYKQVQLGETLEMLPATVECPACKAGNLFDPERLALRPNQFVARAHRYVRH